MTTTEEKTTIQKIYDLNDKYVAIKIPNMYLGYYTFLDKKQTFKDGTVGNRFKCTLLIERSILGDSIEKELRKELHAYAERESLLIDPKNKVSVFIDNGYSSSTSEFYNDKYSITLEKRKNPEIPVQIYRKGEEITDYSIFETAGAKVNAIARFYKSKREIGSKGGIGGKELYYAAFSLSSIEMLELGKWPTNKYGGPLKSSEEENFSNHPFLRKSNSSEIPF